MVSPGKRSARSRGSLSLPVSRVTAECPGSKEARYTVEGSPSRVGAKRGAARTEITGEEGGGIGAKGRYARGGGGGGVGALECSAYNRSSQTQRRGRELRKHMPYVRPVRAAAVCYTGVRAPPAPARNMRRATSDREGVSRRPMSTSVHRAGWRESAHGCAKRKGENGTSRQVAAVEPARRNASAAGQGQRTQQPPARRGNEASARKNAAAGRLPRSTKWCMIRAEDGTAARESLVEAPSAGRTRHSIRELS